MSVPQRTVDHVDAVLDQIGAMPALAVVLLVSAAMFVDASPIVGLLVPGDLLVVTVAAGGHPIQAMMAIVGVVLGTLASWTLFFLIGRRVGPRLRDGPVGRWIGRGRWHTAELLLAGRGAWALTLVQFLPVLNAVIPTVAGVLGMRYRHFIRFAAPGTVLWAILFGGIGVWAGLANDALFGESGSFLQVLVFAAPGFIASCTVLVFLRRQLAALRIPLSEPALGVPGSRRTAGIAA
jgi:membrane-associated protein